MDQLVYGYVLLQLMQQALPLTKAEADKSAVAGFHLRFAELLVHGGGYHEAWRLQYLTDLSKLPDYEDGYWYRGDGRGGRCAVGGRRRLVRGDRAGRAAGGRVAKPSDVSNLGAVA